MRANLRECGARRPRCGSLDRPYPSRLAIVAIIVAIIVVIIVVLSFPFPSLPAPSRVVPSRPVLALFRPVPSRPVPSLSLASHEAFSLKRRRALERDGTG